MTSEEIKAKMKERKLTQAELARRFDTSEASIHHLVNRKMRSDRLEKRLARALGVKLEQLRGTGEAA